MKKIGLDLGSSSIGWAIRNGEDISKQGVITFDSGMVKGQGGYSSPTRDRREARSKRNLIRARKYRKWELLKTLLEKFSPINKQELETWSKYKKGGVRKFPEHEKFLKWLACDFTYKGGKKHKNPYELRVLALEEKLSNHEFGRVLYHIVQRRGYKDIGESDKETETQIKRRDDSGFQKALDKHGTIAKALTQEFLIKGKRARNEYPYRDEYQQELEVICKAQGYDISKEGKQNYHNPFVLSLWKAIIWQRPLKTQKGAIGKCTLEPSKPRCSVSHPLFEVSRSWQFINTIKYYDDDNVKQNLSQEQRNALFNELFLKKDSFKFEDIRKFLDKKLQRKTDYNYPKSEKTGKYETPILGMPFCKGIIKIVGEPAIKAIESMDTYNIGNAPKIFRGYSLFDLWHALFAFDDEYLETFSIKNLGIENITVKRNKIYISMSPMMILKKKLDKGYSNLSLKAIQKIIPFLKEGYLYNEAVVYAKLPEALADSWNEKKDLVLGFAKISIEKYNNFKTIIGIANNLIDSYKGLQYPDIFAYKDFEYLLTESDYLDAEKACISYFGEATWQGLEDKESVISKVGREYQEFFFDSKRAYRETPTLTKIFKGSLHENGIVLHGELYHHSKQNNIYGKNIIDKKTDKKILPVPLIDSIKNPMFNKTLSILRRLINDLIIKGEIDEDTEVVIEVARELNDNNKRAAIERYQNERRNKRAKIREFLKEFMIHENKSFNVEERIGDFELWSEQIFVETDDSTGQKAKEILREKNSIKRYELWMEQKGQCLYTGNMITISQLFSNEIDIEHTIPRSLLPDNTMANLTVCYAKYNRDDKGKLMPYYCKNYSEDIMGVGLAIVPRLYTWKKTRDQYKGLYQSRLKPFGNEDETKKNKRIQEKHYFKMHYDYWRDKVQRFTAKEVKDNWARRQLVDTQMVSKYARKFLKTYFKKIAVQKGIITSDFRKIYGFQEADEIKSRNKHTHHAIDAAVLTLIPINSSHRVALLNEMYELWEKEKKQFTTKPFKSFSSQKLIGEIENQTLIVNYEKDKIIQQTTKNVRKRGQLQYITDTNGSIVEDASGKRIIKKSQGDTVRSTLYKQTFIAKIRDVERYPDGQPIRENGDWKYKTGQNEFMFTERKPIKDVISKIDDIIDPKIRELIRSQKRNNDILDFQGKIIRHVRIKVRAGQVVKERVNYRSSHEYKNFYYSAAGSLPYAVMLENTKVYNVDRKMIPVASYEIAKVFKECRKFDIDYYINAFHSSLKSYADKKLLKVGQKVLVLNHDEEFEQRENIEFQRNRLYRITQFESSGGKVMLQHHLVAQSKADIDYDIKLTKNSLVAKKEKELKIKLVFENEDISNISERKKDFEKRLFDFKNRLKIIEEKSSKETAKALESEVSEFKTEYSSLGNGIQVRPLLKMSKDNWLFLYEGYDFKISTLGEISWIN